MAAHAALAGITPIPTWGQWYWPLGLWAALAYFAAGETDGIITGPRNTLSDFSRWQLGEYPGEPLLAHGWPWFASQLLYVALAVWLLGHIWYDTWG